jgi:hypothetical protein
MNPNRRVLEHIFERFRVLHGQEMKILALHYGPDRSRHNCLPGLPPDHADLDFTAAAEAVFQRLSELASCDSSLTLDPATLRQQATRLP